MIAHPKNDEEPEGGGKMNMIKSKYRPSEFWQKTVDGFCTLIGAK